MHTHACLHTNACTRTYSHTHPCTCAHTDAHLYSYLHTPFHMCSSLCAHIHTRSHVSPPFWLLIVWTWESITCRNGDMLLVLFEEFYLHYIVTMFVFLLILWKQSFGELWPCANLFTALTLRFFIWGIGIPHLTDQMIGGLNEMEGEEMLARCRWRSRWQAAIRSSSSVPSLILSPLAPTVYPSLGLAHLSEDTRPGPEAPGWKMSHTQPRERLSGGCWPWVQGGSPREVFPNQ